MEKVEKGVEKVESGSRKRKRYRGVWLYALLMPNSVELSIANMDEFRTLAGIALIERFMNELLKKGVSREEIGRMAAECSYNSGDISGILSDILKS
jgi:hypothetical protein